MIYDRQGRSVNDPVRTIRGKSDGLIHVQDYYTGAPVCEFEAPLEKQIETARTKREREAAENRAACWALAIYGAACVALGFVVCLACRFYDLV